MWHTKKEKMDEDIWDVLDEKERTMDTIKIYVEVNVDVENEKMLYLGELYGPKDKGMKGIV